MEMIKKVTTTISSHLTLIAMVSALLLGIALGTRYGSTFVAYVSNPEVVNRLQVQETNAASPEASKVVAPKGAR